MSKPKIDISGQIFGRLMAIEPTSERIRGQVAWVCQCYCGQHVLMPGSELRAGRYRSCGCDNRSITHGHYRTPGYHSYRAMVDRCVNEQSKDYPRYGAKGISVCNRWLYGDGPVSGIECFFADMGSRPSPKHSIDRINVRGNYDPTNCRWATPSQQARNTTRNYFPGKSSIEVALAAGVKPGTFRQRVSKGWSLEAALDPRDKRRSHG